MSQQKGPIKASTFPMWILGLVVAVDAMDQSIVRGVQDLIQKDFGINDATVGLLASAFVFVHAVTTIPAGYLADRLFRKRVIAVTIVLWSGITGSPASRRTSRRCSSCVGRWVSGWV